MEGWTHENRMRELIAELAAEKAARKKLESKLSQLGNPKMLEDIELKLSEANAEREKTEAELIKLRTEQSEVLDYVEVLFDWDAHNIREVLDRLNGKLAAMESTAVEQDGRIQKAERERDVLAAALDCLQSAVRDVLHWKIGQPLPSGPDMLFCHLRKALGDSPETILRAYDAALTEPLVKALEQLQKLLRWRCDNRLEDLTEIVNQALAPYREKKEQPSVAESTMALGYSPRSAEKKRQSMDRETII